MSRIRILLAGSILICGCTTFTPNYETAPPLPVYPFPVEKSEPVQRGITSEVYSTESLSQKIEKLRSPEELEKLIIAVSADYEKVPNQEKMMAIEVLMLKPFKGINSRFKTFNFSIKTLDLLKQMTGLDLGKWTINPVVSEYFNVDSSPFKNENDFTDFLTNEVAPSLFSTANMVRNLKQKFYTTYFCAFDCADFKVTTPMMAMRNIFAINYKLSFLQAYNLNGFFLIIKAYPDLINGKRLNLSDIDKLKRNPKLFVLTDRGNQWLNYSFTWLRYYVGSEAMSYDDSRKWTASSDPFVERTIQYHREFVNTEVAKIDDENKTYQINFKDMFKEPTMDLKRLLPTRFDAQNNSALEWDMKSMQRIFPDLSRQQDVQASLSVLKTKGPLQFPFPLSIILNVK